MLRTASDFGIPQQKWHAAKEEARRAMIATASLGRTIYYSDLVKEITAVKFEAHDTRLNHLLGEISSDEHKLGRGMLTAVVVHKSGENKGQPGSGFFELAATLGRSTSDEIQCWSDELNRVHADWGKAPSLS